MRSIAMTASYRLILILGLFMFFIKSRAIPTLCDRVLLVADINNCTAGGEGDEVLIQLVQEAGFKADVRCSLSIETSEPQEYAMVIFLQSVFSGRVKRLSQSATPVIVAEEIAYFQLRLGNASKSSQLNLEIVNASHPLAANLATGSHSVVSDCYGECLITAKTGPEASVVAQVGGESAIFAYEMGSRLLDNTTSPSLRIGLFAGINASITELGKSLIKASISYAYSRSLCPVRQDVIDSTRVIDESTNIYGDLVVEQTGTLTIMAGAVLDVRGCVFLNGSLIIDGHSGDPLLIFKLSSLCIVDVSQVDARTADGCELEIRQDIQSIFAILPQTCRQQSGNIPYITVYVLLLVACNFLVMI